MNGEFQDKNIFKSMKINSLTNNQNNFNDLQFISMDFENNKIINNFEGIKSENQNNGLPINNLNISEISEALKIPKGTIKSTLSRTRRKLKRLINN